jgi:hypothetical protein
MTDSMPVGKSRYDRLRARYEVFLSGRAPDDPFYLTNRTWRQKLRTAALIATPVVLLAGLVTVGATDLFRSHKADSLDHLASEAPAPADTKKHLPDPVLASSDLEVVNIRIARDARPPSVTGVVRNNTSQRVESAEVSYYLSDAAGSLLGTDSTDVANLAPHGSVSFRMPLKVAKAEYVLVRDVHPN